MDQEQKEKFSFGTIHDGAFVEAMDVEIQKLLNNMVDPNAEPGTKREITAKLIAVPIPDSNQFVIKFQANTKLAPDKALTASALYGKQKDGKAVAREVKKRGTELDLPGVEQTHTGDNVRTFTRTGTDPED